MVVYTVTGLKRWSCQNRELPPASQVKALHVYDFDNTLFMSPLPNPKLWTGPTVGLLQTPDIFLNGGWWHDQHILEATGGGIEKEEPRAWEGWWNEQIVNLVELSMRQKDAITILLTGRGEPNFGELIKRIVTSKNLEFDMVCLKQQVGPNGQKFSSTMNFKQALLKDIIHTYKDADEIRVYEDRVKHVKGFREYFELLNRSLLSAHPPKPRRPITAEVIHVIDTTTFLDPVTETAEVQRMINAHNAVLSRAQPSKSVIPPLSNRLQIKRTIFYTGYLISPADTTNLLTLISLPPSMPDSDLKFLANNILITPRPAQKSILDKVGGLGAKQIWQITGTAVYENKIWAARVTPIPPSAPYYTDNPTPIIVLALRKGAKPIDAGRIHNWQPVSSNKQFVFETYVGEKVQLRIEKEVAGEGEYQSLFASKNQTSSNNSKRKHGYEDESEYRHQAARPGYDDDQNRRSNHTNSNFRNPNANRGRTSGNAGSGGTGGHRNPPHSNRGGRGGSRGGGGGGGRGRGGRGGYKSLDDVGNSPRYGQGNGYQNHQPNYDDGPSGQGYENAYPALGEGGKSGNSGGGGGLQYGN